MLSLVLIYFLCVMTGVCVERRLSLDGLLQRVIMIFSAGAGQLMLSIQLLSPCLWLTGSRLMAANVLLTAAACAALAWRRAPDTRPSGLTLGQRLRAELAPLRHEPLALLLVAASLAVAVGAYLVGWAMAPYGDSYHVEMPLFWIQHQSILPFPVHNPRIVSLSFLCEALSLPGFLYARWGGVPALLMLFGWLLDVAVVFALARRIGASLTAAAAAAAIISGYTLFAMEALTAIPSCFLAAAWFGASLVFLMDAHGREQRTQLGCSVFCFVLACGAKNTTALLAPLYLAALLLNLIRLGAPARWVSMGAVLAACGVAGLLCSGVAWNYSANKLWFGSSRGPAAISETVSTDYHPRAIWTRLCRGGVLIAYDTIWLPKSAKPAYAALCADTVQWLGGQRQLAEDDDYYSFQPEVLTTRKGMGLLGMVFFLPGIGVALYRCWSVRGAVRNPAWHNTVLLVVMSVGAFVLCHLVLRWQGIGVLRLMYPFVIAGAPLASLLLARRWLRGTALLLLLVSAAMFSTFWLGNVSRKLGWHGSGMARLMARLQNNHVLPVQCQWQGQPARELIMQEDYTYREIYDELLAGIQQPGTFGLIGNLNAECNFLFGRRFQNRVVPLVDSRASDRIIEPAEGLDYLVAVDKFAEAGEWAETHGFHRILTVSNAGREMLAAYEHQRSDR